MSTSVSADTTQAAAKDRRATRPVPSRLQGASRRSVPHLALGVLLVAVCATGFAVVVSHLDDRTPVLALARPATVGQQLAAADLREVSVAADPGVATLPASEAGDVVGSTITVSLPAGSLLSPAAIDGSALPPAGDAVVAVALGPGQFPPELSAGARVLVVPVADSGGSSPTGGGDGWVAVAVGVHPATTQAITVVSVQLGRDDADALAAAGEVRLVMLSAQDGG